MVAKDEDALICDLAETYHIFDYRALPLPLAARLACGLRHDSRIKMEMSGQTLPMETIMTAKILDCVTWLQWAQTAEAQKNTSSPPQRILPILLGQEAPADDSDIQVFESGEDFTKAYQELINKGGDSDG